MSRFDNPASAGFPMTLPPGDPLAEELVAAIHSGDVEVLRRLGAKRPEFASARIVGRLRGWRTPLHTTAGWSGHYYPIAPTAVGILVEAGADPNDDTGRDRPEALLHWAANDDLEVAVALIDRGANLETPREVRSALRSTTPWGTPAETSPCATAIASTSTRDSSMS